MADEGFKLPGMIVYPAGILFALACGGFYAFKLAGTLKNEMDSK